MFRFYGMLALGALFVVCVCLLIGSLLGEKKRRHRIQSALEAEYDGDCHSHPPEVKDMVALYLSMVAKHGPESEEAKAFRFGTDSALMKRLHGDDGSMAAFIEQADIIDTVFRRLKKGRKSKRNAWRSRKLYYIISKLR